MFFIFKNVFKLLSFHVIPHKLSIHFIQYKELNLPDQK